MKIPRGDIDGVGEGYTDRKTKKDKREECRLTSGGGSKIRSQVERLKHLGARLGTADCLYQVCDVMLITALRPLI